MEIRYAKSQKEVDNAIELAVRNFSTRGGQDFKNMYDARRKCLPQDFSLHNFIVAIDDKKVVGVLRVYKKVLSIGGVKMPVLGLSDYCIDESYKKNPILGVAFYVKCLKILRKSSYPVALGSARRVMGSYYYKFGHISCDTYATCRIEKLKLPQCAILSDVTITESFDRQKSDAYEILRRSVFSSEWAMVLRSKKYWDWIELQILRFKKIRFFEVAHKKKLVGYFILSGKDFIDFGFQGKQFGSYALSMLSFLSSLMKIEEISFHLSPQNKFWGVLGLSHLSYSLRYVPDEGIIALTLNRKKMVDIFCNVLMNTLSQNGPQVNGLSFGEKAYFQWRKGRLSPAFSSQAMERGDEQILLNSLFLGTYGPFNLLHYQGPRVVPPTFFRFNDLDVM